MDARIVEFAQVLRQNGVRVSTSEVQDALRATSEVGLKERPVFRAVLRTTLIKRELDVDIFNRAFDFYFSGAAKTFEALDKSLAQQIVEQMMVAIPAPFMVERDDEQVSAFKLLESLLSKPGGSI